MPYFYSSLPFGVLVALILGTSALVTAVVAWNVHKKVPVKIHQENNPVVSNFFLGVVTLYSVILAFLILISWQDYNEAQNLAAIEANDVLNLYHLVDELPASSGALFKADLIEYTKLVIEDEWAQLSHGMPSDKVDEVILRLWQHHSQVEINNLRDAQLSGKVFDLLNNLTRQRQLRIQQAQSVLTPAMWIILIGGAVVIIFLSLFFRSRNTRSTMVMILSITCFTAYALALIMILDSPFTGSHSISHEDFSRVLAVMQGLYGQ